MMLISKEENMTKVQVSNKIYYNEVSGKLNAYIGKVFGSR